MGAKQGEGVGGWCRTYLVIGEGDEGKRPEGFGDEHVGDLAVLHEELPQLVSGHVLSAAAHKDFAAALGLVGTHLWTKTNTPTS